MTDELYCRLVCALSHNLNACDSCKKCGETSPDARINLIRELAREENMPIIIYYNCDDDFYGFDREIKIEDISSDRSDVFELDFN